MQSSYIPPGEFGPGQDGLFELFQSNSGGGGYDGMFPCDVKKGNRGAKRASWGLEKGVGGQIRLKGQHSGGIKSLCKPFLRGFEQALDSGSQESVHKDEVQPRKCIRDIGLEALEKFAENIWKNIWNMVNNAPKKTA